MGRDRSTWLVFLFLLAGVAAPAVCVLWFMNAAASSQAASARQMDVEKRDVNRTLLQRRQGIGDRFGLHAGMPRLRQDALVQTPDGRFVLNDQNCGVVCHHRATLYRRERQRPSR